MLSEMVRVQKNLRLVAAFFHAATDQIKFGECDFRGGIALTYSRPQSPNLFLRIAAARVIPGVWGVLVSISPARTTLTPWVCQSGLCAMGTVYGEDQVTTTKLFRLRP